MHQRSFNPNKEVHYTVYLKTTTGEGTNVRRYIGTYDNSIEALFVKGQALKRAKRKNPSAKGYIQRVYSLLS